MERSMEIFDRISSFNWDDEIDIVEPLLRSKDCDFASALLAYWRLEGPFHYPAELSDHPYKDLLAELEEGLISGRYAKGSLRFCPKEDEQISDAMLHKLAKSGVPKVLLEPSYG